MMAYDLVCYYAQWIWSTEGRNRFASKSEVRRWFERQSVVINGKTAKMDDELKVVTSLILFPNGKRRTTLI